MTHQIDGHIEHKDKSYRCECKWKKDKVSYDEMLKFSDKIDAVGVSGLFISISGFSDAAINKSKELRSQKAIILIDGNDVELVMTGSIHFDDLLNAKRRAFDSMSETYYPIRVSLGDG
jgi:restriction endonuclease Mrr